MPKQAATGRIAREPKRSASPGTDAAIAEALNLGLKTVRNDHYGIKQKIGADNDAHLVWPAVGAGLIEGLGNGT